MHEYNLAMKTLHYSIGTIGHKISISITEAIEKVESNYKHRLSLIYPKRIIRIEV
jgi:hypothetical protein